jgi:hypothetical protein
VYRGEVFNLGGRERVNDETTVRRPHVIQDDEELRFPRAHRVVMEYRSPRATLGITEIVRQ